ncbi:NIL domain-containing protein [Xanthomonas campestris pv. raphani]|uniref:NIL domain-containing protein n=1 Tax=Xanthomonas campestris TaxID=339 RepID=UPI001E4C4A49|nr:NIL domain-containing protein [Xanthomonas campestris]MCC5069112.1 NIL domain-containing protein [Xanthomonas campestris]MEA9786270.1 NIL domain-containing protein [Xanthomonas campestris pv. raphani]
MNFKECQEKTKSSIIKVSDKGSTHATFLNKENFSYTVVKFDGCVVKNAIACDWIIEKAGVGRLVVELKGSDVDHAAEQIAAALRFLQEKGLKDLKVAALIICSRYPSIDTKVQRIKQRLARDYRAPVTVKTDGRNLVFDKLLKF